MWWFKSRPKQRKQERRDSKFSLEQLESREAAGNVWLPASAIDISGLTWDSRIFVAGEVVELAIAGTGLDWDVSIDAENGTPGGAADTVTITWSGVSCEVLDGGRRALCTLGSPGSPGIFDITMFADDAAITQSGDSGSRDDEAVQFAARLPAIWVGIQVKMTGPLDKPDNRLSFFGSPETVDDTPAGRWVTGQVSPPTSWGFFTKVELIGKIEPAGVVPDGTGGFDWKQIMSVTECNQHRDGTWTGGIVYPPDPPGGYGTWQDDSNFLEGDSKQTDAIHDKIYAIDNPGWFTGNNNDRKIGLYDRRYVYQDFLTHVEFAGKRVSIDTPWHVVTKIVATTDANGNWVWTKEVPTDAGIGLMENSPSGDCSVRP